MFAFFLSSEKPRHGWQWLSIHVTRFFLSSRRLTLFHHILLSFKMLLWMCTFPEVAQLAFFNIFFSLPPFHVNGISISQTSHHPISQIWNNLLIYSPFINGANKMIRSDLRLINLNRNLLVFWVRHNVVLNARVFFLLLFPEEREK